MGKNMPRPVFLISACLAGLCTRYDGSSRSHPRLPELAARAVLVPVCPEILGGMGIPRSKCRFHGGDGLAVLRGLGRVIDIDGNDRTEEFVRGAREARYIAELIRPELVVLKEGSPSCGLLRVDVEGHKGRGCGVTTAMLRDLGIPMITEEDSLPPNDQSFSRDE
jgi:uncharacterized protein YbbK (DUF523 family)